jgi:undecaprenyl-phosphate 4-deoxy-4-formamido-L-arabinose transferase
MTDSHAFALSIVVPVYNGAASVPPLVEALAGLNIPGGHEIVLVNDGSPDNSLEVCTALCHRYEIAITVVNLTRNFGEHNAVMAGLRMARGAYVITMDDDLQNPPEEAARLYHYAAANRFDAVYTYYAKKQHSLWRNLGSRLTNALGYVLIGKPRNLYLSSFRCLSAFVAKNVAGHNGPFPYVDGLIMQITQNIGRLEVKHLARAEGRSNYTLRRLVRLFLSMFLNFSVIPLRIASLLGAVTAVLGVFGFVDVVIEALRGNTPTGWASLMAALLVVSGVQLIVLGVIGEYLGRAFLTLNHKPQFIVRDVERNAAANIDLERA